MNHLLRCMSFGLTRVFLPAAALLALAAAARAQNAPPEVEHSPVAIAVHGQNIAIRTVVSDDAAQVKSVTLFYTASRDAAPIRIPMRNAASVIYTATIPSELFAGLSRLYYYIEARDDQDAAVETPWYSVDIRSLDPRPDTPATAPAVQIAPGAAASEPEGRGWIRPTLYTAGGLLAAGGAYLALSGGDDDDDDDPVTPPPTNSTNAYAGSYWGNATTCFQPPNESPQCAQGPATIVIDAAGRVSSTDLRPGQPLTTALSGPNFVLTAPVNETNRTGELVYVGTVVNTRIVGTIQGTAETPDGGVGTYSGSFNMFKQ